MGSGLAASGFDYDDGFAERDFARGREKRTRITNRLHVHNYRMGSRIVTEIIDQISPAHIEHGANRNERAEADDLLLSPVEDRRAQGAALTDKGNVARPRHVRGKGGVETADGIHHTQTIRANQ